jgi:CBS domain-containing protein
MNSASLGAVGAFGRDSSIPASEQSHQDPKARFVPISGRSTLVVVRRESCPGVMNIPRYVEEVMTEPVVAVQPDLPAEEVARQLARRRIGAVPVVDRAMHVVGIVAESDLLNSGGPGGTARDAMTTPVVTVSAGTTAAEARALLLARDIGRLPVVDGDGRLLGIVSRRDLLGSLLPGDDEVRRRIIDRVIDFGGEVYTASVSGGSVHVRGRVTRAGEVAVLEKLLRETPGVVDLQLDFIYDVDDVRQEQE